MMLICGVLGEISHSKCVCEARLCLDPGQLGTSLYPKKVQTFYKCSISMSYVEAWVNVKMLDLETGCYAMIHTCLRRYISRIYSTTSQEKVLVYGGLCSREVFALGRFLPLGRFLL